MTVTEVMAIANEAGMSVDIDNDYQLIVFTGIPEGAPEVAQTLAWQHGWSEEVDNDGQIMLFTGVYDDEDSESYSDNARLS